MNDEQKEDVKQIKDTLLQWLGVAFFIFLICYGAPSIIILIVNFFKLVVFGGWKMSEFKEYYEALSWERVNLFYKQLFDWFSALANRLQS